MTQARRLPVINIAGTARECGRIYGEQERESILGFLGSQIDLRADRLNLAEACWSIMQQALPEVAEFCRGLAAGAQLTLPQLMVLLLHEELLHQEHCSVIGLSSRSAADGRAAVAQNWDWPADVYAWPKLLQLRTAGAPATFTYAFPGLWACAGVNEAGLALCWSGAGYWPNVEPVAGIPTYALIAGLLAKSDVSGALELLSTRQHAGCFIFFLADSRGELAIVEGWPGGLAVTRNAEVECRTNHYLAIEAAAAVHQHEPAEIEESTTAARLKTIESLLAREPGKLDGSKLRQILSHEDVRAAYVIDDLAKGYMSMTIDSFCIYPDTGEIWLARGLPERHGFARYALGADDKTTSQESQQVAKQGS